MTRYAISSARSAVKIFLFPVAKRAGTVHGIYKPVKAKNACDSSDQQVLYTCLSGKKDRGESSPRPTYTNLLHSRFNPVHVYTRTHSREGPMRQRLPGGRESNACLGPFIGLRTPLVLPASRTWRNVREDSTVHV